MQQSQSMTVPCVSYLILRCSLIGFAIVTARTSAASGNARPRQSLSPTSRAWNIIVGRNEHQGTKTITTVNFATALITQGQLAASTSIYLGSTVFYNR